MARNLSLTLKNRGQQHWAGGAPGFSLFFCSYYGRGQGELKEQVNCRTEVADDEPQRLGPCARAWNTIPAEWGILRTGYEGGSPHGTEAHILFIK